MRAARVKRRFATAIRAIAILALVSCGGGGGGANTPPLLPTLSSSSSGGSFNSAQVVTLTSSNAVIYLTTDGSLPTTGSQRYDGPLTVLADITIRAVAIDSRNQSSNVLTLNFVIDTQAPADFALESSETVITADNQNAFDLTVVNAEMSSVYAIEINDDDADTAAVSLSGSVSNASVQALQANLSSLANGQISAVLLLTDTVGNVSEPFTLQLIKAVSANAFVISGSVNVASLTQIDSDVNETSTLPINNNSFADAQLIFSPGALGGYVNQPGTGSAGNSQSSGDEDFFSVNLSAGDTVMLTIANTDTDLDAELYDIGGVLVDDSLGVGNTETLTAPSDGDYFIRVFSFSGASNYVMTLGAPRASVVTNRVSSFDLFEANKVLVQLGEKRDQALSVLLASLSMINGDLPDQSMLMAFSSPEARDQMIATQNPLLYSGRITATARTERHSKQETLWAIKAISRLSGVRWATPNYVRSAFVTPNDTLYSEQWHYPQIRLPQAWDVTTGSADVTVAVIDTGILSRHPDFAGQLTLGADLISDSENAGDGNGVDSDPEDIGDGGLGDGSSSFHGTHVAGTIAAATDNNLGVSGVAWNSRIMPVRVLGRSGGTSFDLIQSIRFAAGLSNTSNTLPIQAADVINMSLGGGGFSQSEADALDAARNAGVIVVAAAGNSGSNRLEYPASYEGVVSVSATNQSNQRTDYSNFGLTVDVAAPGGDSGQDIDADGIPDGVLSTIGSDRENSIAYGYRRYQGTSMAAPHVAGVIALMKAKHPGLTPAEFDQVLNEGRITDDLGAKGRDDQFGHGLINAEKAVVVAEQLASGSLQPLPPALLATPRALNFGFVSTQQSLTFTNAGAGDLTISSVAADADWLTIDASSANDEGLGSYRVVADRMSLVVGNYVTNIAITASAGNLQVPVSLRVSASPFSPSAGVLFALLIDPALGETVHQQRLDNPQDGAYILEIPDVAPGSYRFLVGSDLDNDGFICDAGEACGAYPTLAEEEETYIAEDTAFSLDISFDQTRFLQLHGSHEDAEEFPGYRYKASTKTVHQ